MSFGDLKRWLYRGQRPHWIARILNSYLKRAVGARPHIPVNKDGSLAEFEKIAASFPVFRIGSREP
jgi:hypothetical protein